MLNFEYINIDDLSIWTELYIHLWSEYNSHRVSATANAEYIANESGLPSIQCMRRKTASKKNIIVCKRIIAIKTQGKRLQSFLKGILVQPDFLP